MHRIAQSYRRTSSETNDTRVGGRVSQPPHYLRNAGRRWSQGEVATLRTLAQQKTPTRVIGLRLGRSERAIYSKAFDERIALRTAEHSPYADGGERGSR